MKQYITIEQLNELSLVAKEKLKKWWWNGLDDISRWVEKDAHRTIGSPIFPSSSEITIGLMLEFLQDHKTIVYESQNGMRCDLYWSKDGELCDNLWEAVKGVLKEKKQ